jgi:RimJ/RimL family protein N-acetyltransferase
MAFAWDELPRLRFQRVRLRPLSDADVPALFRIFGDSEVMRFWSSPPLEDLGAARGLLDHIRRSFEARTLFQWGITTVDDDAVVGTCTIFHIDHDHRRAEIGFAIGRADWRKGYASDAVTALVRFAFDQLDLHRLEADPDPQNQGSIRVLERQGFRREGLLRERYFLNEQPQDAAYYGLLRREWTNRG